MNILRFFTGLAATLLLTATTLAQSETDPAAGASSPPQKSTPSTDDPLELPKMTVNSGRLSDYPLIPKTDLIGGGLAPSEPPVSLFFPGSAYADGVPKGLATVCVELDEKGNATDYLLVAYTEKYFGDALLRTAKDTKYGPLLFKGVPIPSRFNFGYEFKPEFTVAISSFGAMKNRLLQVRGGQPDFKYYPVTEEIIDSRLEYIRQAVPYFPDGYKPTGEKADWVMVSLYVDEEGHVRVPHVESASSPLLVRNALKAVHYWQFKPPTLKGKPVLVYAAFAVTFTKVEE